jgi:hypothetical protein
MEMRLLKAGSLLVDPDAKIIYVAEKCGFNHLGLFNTCFKKRFGTSPSQWRKAITEAKKEQAGVRSGGCPFQDQGSCVHSDKPISDHARTSQSRPLDQVPLCGLLKDIVAGSHSIAPQIFSSKETGRSRISA